MAQSTVRLIVDAQNAVSPLRRVNEATKNLSRNTDKLKERLNKSNRSIRESGRAAKSASGGFATLNKSLMPLLKALAVIATTRFVFVNAADIETQRKSLEVLTGSLSKTNQIIKELQDFGAVTPFTSSELIEQSKRLKAFGFTTDELTDSVKRLSNIAGATGADLSGIATAFGQIRAKGKLQQEENLQLLERGVDITTELKRITGLQGEEFESAMRKGEIGADLVNQAMINLTNEGGAFFGGATAQADTLNGKLSTLIDATQNLARTVGEELSPAIKGALDLATKGVIAIDKMFSRFGDIGDVGLGNVAKAEQDAKRDAARLTAIKFGTNFKGESIFASKAENEFFKQQFQLLREQNIERLKLKKTQFQEVEIIEKKIEKEKEHKDLIESTSFSFSEGLIPSTDLFNQNLDLSGAFLNDINLLTLKISDSFKFLKTDADLLNDKFAQIGNTIATGVSDALVGAVMQTQSLAQAASSMLNDIASQLLRLGINTFLSSTFGGIFSSLDTFATGGRPPVGRPSIVGEKGPELFVPSTAGTIIPNNQLSGSTTNVVVNVDASGSAVEGDEDKGRELGRLISVAVQSELVQQKRPGGLLA